MASVLKYKAKESLTIANTLLHKDDIVWIENNKGAKQVFDIENKFIGTLDKYDFKKKESYLQLIGD